MTTTTSGTQGTPLPKHPQRADTMNDITREASVAAARSRRSKRSVLATGLVRFTASMMVVSSIAGLASIAAKPAGATGFDHWAGNLELDYRSPEGIVAQNLQNLDPGLNLPSLQSTFADQWANILPSICPTINAQVAQQVQNSGYSLASWDGCWMNPTGDLQATMLGPNQLALTWLVTGNSFSFDVNAFSTPKINATYDLEIDLVISANSTINGTDTASSPPAFTLESQTVRFSNANFSSNNVFLNAADPSFGSHADNALDSKVLDLSTIPGHPDFYNIIGKYNALLIKAAALVATDYVQKYFTPGANEYFDLIMSITPTNLVITLAKDGVPPADPPVGCELYGSNVFLCSAQQPADIKTLLLSVNGPVVQSVSYLQDGAWSNANFDGRPELTVNGVGTYQVSVCGVDLWGQKCTALTTVNVPPPPDGGGGSGGGGASGGGVNGGVRGHAHE